MAHFAASSTAISLYTSLFSTLNNCIRDFWSNRFNASTWPCTGTLAPSSWLTLSWPHPCSTMCKFYAMHVKCQLLDCPCRCIHSSCHAIMQKPSHVRMPSEYLKDIILNAFGRHCDLGLGTSYTCTTLTLGRTFPTFAPYLRWWANLEHRHRPAQSA